MDAVERQFAAYNARDVDAFVACFSDRVVFEDARGGLVARGPGELRQQYGPMFRDRPDLRAEVTVRERFGEYVVDVEVVTGLGPEPVRGVAIYHVGEDGLIDHVRFVR